MSFMPLMQNTSEGIEIQKKLDNLTNIIENFIQKQTKTDERTLDFLKQLTSIMLRMNERDCNREELYEELDKLSKEWFSKTL